LSFLGLGQQPPAPSWGSMLNTARNYVDQAPWMAIWPGVSIFLLVLSFNLLGDGLRDALDPRTSSGSANFSRGEMPVCFTTRAHLSASAFMSAAVSSAVEVFGSKPCSIQRCLIAGDP
jgi:hypothetical protein